MTARWGSARLTPRRPRHPDPKGGTPADALSCWLAQAGATTPGLAPGHALVQPAPNPAGTSGAQPHRVRWDGSIAGPAAAADSCCHAACLPSCPPPLQSPSHAPSGHVGVLHARTPWAWRWPPGTVPTLVVLPRALAASGVAQASGQRVLLERSRGTVGRARPSLVLTGGPPARTRRHCRPATALAPAPGLGGLRAQARPPAAPLHTLLLQAWARWRGRRASPWPMARALACRRAGRAGGTPEHAAAPRPALTRWKPGAWSSHDWAAGRGAARAGATLDALSMSSRLSTLRPQGQYQAAHTAGRRRRRWGP